MSGVVVLRTPESVERTVSSWRRMGHTVALVPTMGALHEGHISLVSIARKRCKRVIVSIFVNPAQFAPGEDFMEYPRSFEEDRARLEESGAHAVFVPDEHMIYPMGFSTTVEVSGITDSLCGRFRPGHFNGVSTVCAVLFGMVKPDVVVFGRKDAQQLAVIRRMVRDLWMGLEIVSGPTLREADGLAMSSRNRYLRDEERRQATALYRGLMRSAQFAAEGERNAERLIARAMETIESSPLLAVQYLELVDPFSLKPLKRLKAKGLLAVAAHIGKTRLIDNVMIGPSGAVEED
jgi:pantoate--beta-alanine ligase